MKRLRWQLVIVFLALVAIAILLLTQQQPETVTPFFEPEPVTGGVYTEGLVGSFLRFNPVLDYYNPADRDVDRLLYGSLVRYDARGLPQADIAESWGISRDGTIYNFSLRPDAVWHDGEPVTAGDVAFTIEMLRSPELPIPADVQSFWDQISITVLDDLSLRFELPEPFSPFLDYLTFGILPAHILEGQTPEGLIDDPFNLSPVGSGPYRFEQMIVENGQIAGVILTAFDDYHGERPFIDQFIFRYYADDVAALEAYQAGEIQGISRITPEALPEALQEPALNFYTGRLPEMTIIILNLDNPETPFFQEASIRRALLNGINRQWIVDRLLDGQAAIADGPILPGTWAYYDGTERVPYDSAKAIKTLKEMGYTIPASGGDVRANEDDVYLEFTLLHPDTAEHTALAESIRNDWAPLGVRVTLQAVPYDELISDYLNTRLYHAALVDLSLAHTPDPDPYPFWHQTQATGGQNYSLWNDRQASEYLEQARIVADPEERGRLYRNFQVRFASELPALPLFYPMYTYGVDAEIQGLRVGPLFDFSDRFANVTEWYLFAEQKLGEYTEPTETVAP